MAAIEHGGIEPRRRVLTIVFFFLCSCLFRLFHCPLQPAEPPLAPWSPSPPPSSPTAVPLTLQQQPSPASPRQSHFMPQQQQPMAYPQFMYPQPAYGPYGYPPYSPYPFAGMAFPFPQGASPAPRMEEPSVNPMEFAGSGSRLYRHLSARFHGQRIQPTAGQTRFAGNSAAAAGAGRGNRCSAGPSPARPVAAATP